MLATKVRFPVSDPRRRRASRPTASARPATPPARAWASTSIDLYQVHAPDTEVPLEDTLEALDGLVRAGKVRALGASNFPAWLLAWAVALQDRHGWSPFVSLQPQYSLVERSIEVELLPFCRAAGLGVIPWGPLGAGFLSGRYRRGEPSRRPARAWPTRPTTSRRPSTGAAIERNFAAVDAAEAIAARDRRDRAQVALAWLLAQPGVTAPIVGPRTLEQLEDLLGADAIELTPTSARAGGPGAAAGRLPQPDADRAGRAQALHAAAAPRLGQRGQQALEV